MSAPPLGSLSYIDMVAALDPVLKGSIDRRLVQTYDQFIDQLWIDFDQACTKLQERRDQYHDKHEDVITSALVMFLDGMGYNSNHDTKVNGHVDIVVRGKLPTFLWIGEAKRDTGMAWIAQGFDQLCNDYATGGLTQDVGAVIIYCQKGKSTERSEEWRKYFEMLAIPTCVVSDCLRTPATAFMSTHSLSSSGTIFKTRHISLNLHKPVVPATPKKRAARKKSTIAAKKALTGAAPVQSARSSQARH